MPFVYPTRDDLTNLVHEAAYPLVSMILKTHRITNDADRISVKNAMAGATKRLDDEGLDRSTRLTMADQIASVEASIDFTRLTEGLAIYASTASVSVFNLSFDPRPAVTVDSTYLLKPIIRQLNREQPYYLLALSEQRTRLWEGVRYGIDEIQEDGFPAVHEGVGGAFGPPRGFGKRRSQLRDEGHRTFFREVIANFRTHLARDERPVVVAAVPRYHAFIRELGGLGTEVISEIEGNVDRVPEHELGAQAWAAIEQRYRDRYAEWIAQAAAAEAAGAAVRGLDDIYQSALAGSVRRLIAENSYVVAATIDDSGHLHKDAPPAGEGPGHVDDAVDFIASEVLRRGGEVRYVDEGALADFGGVVGILRY